MTKTRAPRLVAQHFFAKYGHEEAINLISSQLEKNQRAQDAAFWQEVLQLLETFHQDLKGPASCNVSAEENSDHVSP